MRHRKTCGAVGPAEPVNPDRQSPEATARGPFVRVPVCALIPDHRSPDHYDGRGKWWPVGPPPPTLPIPDPPASGADPSLF